MTGEPPTPPPASEPPSWRPLWVPPTPAKRPHPLALGCAGIASFGGAIIVFLLVGLASLNNRIFGILIPLAFVGLMIWAFVSRTRRGPAPLLGASVVGLSIAMTIYGLCYASMGGFRIQ